MELYDYYRLIVRHLPILLLTSLLGFSAALYINYTATPMYLATADVFVTTPSPTLDVGQLSTGSNFTEQRVISYAQIINGPDTLGPVIKKLGMDITPEALARQVKATAPNGTVLITVIVIDTDPNRAAAIANAVTEQFEITVQNLELTSTTTDASIKVTPVRQAIPNYTPAAPNKPLNTALGLILGFGVGAGIVTLLLIFDRTVKNEDHLNKLPLLGTIRFDATARDKPLLTELSKYSARTEAFRQLRTNLQMSELSANAKVIAITSALPNEGKTTTVLNLAFSLADAGARVAVVDADLRRPQLKLFLQMPDDSLGVSDILSNPERLQQFISRPASFMHKVNSALWVLGSGVIPPNAAELLGKEDFKNLIASLRKSFDLVLLDCPPTLPIADPAVIAKNVDGVLLVVKAGKTRITQFRGALATLTNVNALVLGCVLNMIPTNRRAEEYGYRYGYSNYYGYKGNKSNKSLYSPEEPYGPALVVDPEHETIDDFEEFRETPSVSRGPSKLVTRKILRFKDAVANRLLAQLDEIQNSSESQKAISEDSTEPGIQREFSTSPEELQESNVKRKGKKKTGLFSSKKGLNQEKLIPEPKAKSSDEIVEEIMRAITAKAELASKPQPKKASVKKATVKNSKRAKVQK